MGDSWHRVTALEALRRGRALLATGRWFQDNGEDVGEDVYCATTALGDDCPDADDVLADAICRTGFPRSYSTSGREQNIDTIIEYNDTRGRTLADILARYDEAIATLESASRDD